MGQDEAVEIPRVEGVVKCVELDYRGVKIELVQLEHHPVGFRNGLEIEDVPGNWREIVGKEFEGAKTVFLEYFPPDMRGAKNIPVIGFFVGMWQKQKGVSMFGEMGEMAATIGARVAVADVARGPMYAWQELAVDQPRWREEIRKLSEEQRAEYGGRYDEIHPLEMNQPWAVDARRLMTARAMMQEARGMQAGERLVWVGAPAHGLRIENYIKRQIESETRGEVSPSEESEKIKKYKSTPGFDCRVRYYEKGKWGWRGENKLIG
jgi:hypothetical protein